MNNFENQNGLNSNPNPINNGQINPNMMPNNPVNQENLVMDNIANQNNIGGIGPQEVVPNNMNMGYMNPQNTMESLSQPGINPSENITPNVEKNTPSPANTPANTINNVTPAQNFGSIPPQNPSGPINLAPEGVVTPVAPAPPAAPAPAEPLMGTTLNSDTVLNQNPMNSGVTPNPNLNPNPAPNMNMNMANPVGANGMVPPTNNAAMFGVPTPPPMNNQNQKTKKPLNKTLVIVLVIVLIAAVGLGVYYFLFASKSKTQGIKITSLLTDTVELGTTVPEDISSYAKVTGTSLSSCELESNLNTKKAGTYKYTITCGKEKLEKTVTVKDTIAPVVVLKDVIITPNAKYSAEDFIESVEDASDCTYEIEEEIDVSTSGEYSVNIIVKDEYQNETSLTGKLIVDENAPTYYLNCERETTTDAFENATITTTYRYGINALDELYNTRKTVVYTFEKEDDYLDAKETINDNVFDNLSGNIKTNDEDFTISVSAILETSDLETEFNVSPFPTGEIEIESLHIDLDDNCTIE